MAWWFLFFSRRWYAGFVVLLDFFMFLLGCKLLYGRVRLRLSRVTCSVVDLKLCNYYRWVAPKRGDEKFESRDPGVVHWVGGSLPEGCDP